MKSFLKRNVLNFMLIAALIIGFGAGMLTHMQIQAKPVETGMAESDPEKDAPESVVESSAPEAETTARKEYVRFTATAYCPCELCCGKWAQDRPVDENGETIVLGASGQRLKAGYSIAADPSYAFGTEFEIFGMGTYVVQDRGGAITGNHIDIYFDTHEEALQFGKQTVLVYVAGTEGTVFA